MKFIHISDLHLGKRIYETSLIEDQRHILEQILQIIAGEQPDGVMIAGDIYDKAFMPVEAVTLFDDFLNALHERSLPVYIISGNHDSADRLAFGSKILSMGNIHIAPPYSGTVFSVDAADEFGTVHIYLLPFVKRSQIKSLFPDEEIETATDALRSVIGKIGLDPVERNVLIAHQFITGAKISESEEHSVGGTDNVDASAFAGFDYVALGHLHGPQPIERETVRYSGTPLKYSFSEAQHEKSVTVVELKEKGNVVVRTVPLFPLHDMRDIRGTYEELMHRGNNESEGKQDFIRAILTDESDVPDAMARLRSVYPNILTLEYDNKRTQGSAVLTETVEVEKKTPYDLFSEFFEWRNNIPMDPQQQKIINDLIEEIWKEEA